MESPELWLIAGPNGAGKTTFSQRKPLSELLSHVRLLNPDDLALRLLKSQGFSSYSEPDDVTLRAAFRDAADRIFDELDWSLNCHEAVAVETVLSTEKYRPCVDFVAKRSGFFGLIYIALNSPVLACQRVGKRTAHGGHGVPVDKIHSRWKRSIDTLPWFAKRANLLLVYDNSDDVPSNPPALLASGGGGQVVIHDMAAIPEVTQALLRVPEP